MTEYLCVGGWSIGEGGKRVFTSHSWIILNQSFIHRYSLDSYGYGQFFEHFDMPTVKDIFEHVNRVYERNIKEKDRKKYQIKADNRAEKVLEFLKKQNQDDQIRI